MSWKVLFIIVITLWGSLSMTARAPKNSGPMQAEEFVEIELPDENTAGMEFRP